MKQLLLGLMLLVTATAASAEWTRTVSGGNDELIEYVDRATIRRNGNLVKMWDLMDYKTIQKGATGMFYLSSKVQSEYDCKEEKIRTLAFTWFAGQMGNGKVVYSGYDSSRWVPIPPGSVGETLWKVGCGK